MLDGFIAEHPPTDLLVAAYLGFKPKDKGDRRKVSMREAVRMNTSTLSKMPMRRNVKTLAQMPAFLRTPEQMAMIEEMKRQCQTSS